MFLRLGALFSPLLELLAGATSDQVQMELNNNLILLLAFLGFSKTFYFFKVPMFILGGFAITSGLLTMLFLPETLGAGLPEVGSFELAFT